MTGSEARRVAEALAVMDAHLGERLTLPRLAALLDVSPFHLAHVFKHATGVAPHQYLVRRRLERARDLLARTKLPIADIALAVGFASQSHFSASFHRATGVTPQAYRLLR
jgi:AraC family transcriptional regulator